MTKQLIVGNAVSKTNWAGLLIAVLGYLQLPEVHATLVPFIDEKWLAIGTSLAGLLIVVIRNMTVESVVEKGARVLSSGE